MRTFPKHSSAGAAEAAAGVGRAVAEGRVGARDGAERRGEGPIDAGAVTVLGGAGSTTIDGGLTGGATGAGTSAEDVEMARGSGRDEETPTNARPAASARPSPATAIPMARLR